MSRIVSISLAGVLLFSVSLVLGSGRIQAAAPTGLLFGQSCTPANTVNVNMSWRSDPSARELWLDYSTLDESFAPGTFGSEGPLSGRTQSHLWRDLEPHRVYWFRVNQLMPSGEWEASNAARYTLGCGNVNAPDGSIQITGFGDGSNAPQTPPNGRLKSCNPATLVGYIRVTGLKEITDITFVWYQGATVILRQASAFDSLTTTRSISVRRAGGASEGPYALEVWSGGDGTWKRSARATFDLDC